LLLLLIWYSNYIIVKVNIIKEATQHITCSFVFMYLYGFISTYMYKWKHTPPHNPKEEIYTLMIQRTPNIILQCVKKSRKLSQILSGTSSLRRDTNVILAYLKTKICRHSIKQSLQHFSFIYLFMTINTDLVEVNFLHELRFFPVTCD